MTNYVEKKDSIWSRIQKDCDIDELIYETAPLDDSEEKASDR